MFHSATRILPRYYRMNRHSSSGNGRLQAKNGDRCRKAGIPIADVPWEEIKGGKGRRRKLISGVLYRREAGDDLFENTWSKITFDLYPQMTAYANKQLHEIRNCHYISFINVKKSLWYSDRYYDIHYDRHRILYDYSTVDSAYCKFWISAFSVDRFARAISFAISNSWKSMGIRFFIVFIVFLCCTHSTYIWRIFSSAK